MPLLKCFVLLCFGALVLSSEVEEQKPGLDLNDLFRDFPEYQEKLRVVVDQLQNASTRAQVAILNDYADDVLVNLGYYILDRSLDPVPMPDIEDGFEFVWLWVKYKGVMSLTSGWLQGLSTMTRRGSVTLWYEYPNVKIHLPLSYDVLLYDYKYKAKFMGIGPAGGLDGRVEGCHWTLDVNLDMITLKAALDKYKLENLGKISLKLNGNALVDWMVNMLIGVTIPMIKPVIRLVVQGFILGGIETVIDTYNSGVCFVMHGCE